MYNPELDSHRKIYNATGLKAGDSVIDPRRTSGVSCICLGIGYAAVKLSDGRRVIWHSGFVKEK